MYPWASLADPHFKFGARTLYVRPLDRRSAAVRQAVSTVKVPLPGQLARSDPVARARQGAAPQPRRGGGRAVVARPEGQSDSGPGFAAATERPRVNPGTRLGEG